MDSLINYNPGQKSMRHLSWITYPLSPLNNVGKYRVFSNKKVKNHPIINIATVRRGGLACCPNLVRDCRSFLYTGILLIYLTHKEALAVYYTVIKHDGHLRTRAADECFLHFSSVLKCPECFITV